MHMSMEQLIKAKNLIAEHMANVAAKPVCLLRMIRLHRLNKRMDSLNRGLWHLENPEAKASKY